MTLTIDIDEQTREWLEREARMSGKAVEEIAAELVKAPAQNTTSTPRPNLGFAAGWGIWVSDDFDAAIDEAEPYEVGQGMSLEEAHELARQRTSAWTKIKPRIHTP